MTGPLADVASAAGASALLAEVEACIAARVAGRPALQAYALGGKRLRARLVLLPVAGADARGAADAVRWASFVELVHAGTLCHDDVVDRSSRRRSRPTVVATDGTRAATFAGLLLMWRGYALVAADAAEVRAAVARAAHRVAAGQAEEMTDLWLETSPERFLARQRDKTAALFELAAWLGARAAGLGAADAAAFTAVGERVGLAFQIADDLRDFAGAADLGREPGVDLREGVLTLPVLLALQDAAWADALRAALRRLRASRDPADVARCRAMAVESGGLARAEAMVVALWDDAVQAADVLADASVRRAALAYVEGARRALAWRSR